MESENRNYATAESTTTSVTEAEVSPNTGSLPWEQGYATMRFGEEAAMLTHENRSSLMRNVKREKTAAVGASDRSEKMQTMTIADSCQTDTESMEHSSRMSSDDDEHGELQKEFDNLLEENRRLKQQTQKKDILKRKITMLKKENETLKTAQEQQLRENSKPDSSEPNSNHSPNAQTAPKDHGVFAKSFLLTSTLGGIYIEPIDGANGLSKVPGADGNPNSPSSYSNFLSNNSPSSSFIYKPEKQTVTAETQTPSNYSTPISKPSVYHYSPRVKVATTEEDEEAHRFVQEFKARRIALKLTQSDIGEELNLRAGARYGQSYISRMESIQLSTAIVLRMKPLLMKLLEEKEDERRRMKANADFDEEEYQIDRKRKKRTNFTPDQSLLLTKYFADQPRPSPQEIDEISRKIDVDRNSVKMWFNNKRQAEKFRVHPLPGIGSINSVGSLNPYAAANPYAMGSSFLMSGLMSNMQNAMNPIVTTSSLNNLKLDYNLGNKLPTTTLSLENVSLPNTQAPFVFNKDLNQLYALNSDNNGARKEHEAKLSKDLTQLYQNSLNSVCNNLKKSPKSGGGGGGGGSEGSSSIATSVPFSLPSQSASAPFMFNKELSSLYQNNRTSSGGDEQSPTHKLNTDLAQLYKDRMNEGVTNGANFAVPTSPTSATMTTIKAISPNSNPAFSLGQSIINRTLSQAALAQDPAQTP